METRLYQMKPDRFAPLLKGQFGNQLGTSSLKLGTVFARVFLRVFSDETGSQNWFPLKGNEGGNQFLTLTGERVLMTLSSVFVSVIRRREPVGNQLGTSSEKGTSFLQNDAENKATRPLPGDLQQFAFFRPALQFFPENRVFHRDSRIS